MKTIWKYTLDLIEHQTLWLPDGARVLALQVQEGRPCVWALVDTDAPPVEVEFVTIGTGHDVAPELIGPTATHVYLGTYQLPRSVVSSMPLVFHVFKTRIVPFYARDRQPEGPKETMP